MKIKERQDNSIQDITKDFIKHFGPFTLKTYAIEKPNEELSFMSWELVHPDLGVYMDSCLHRLIQHCYNILMDKHNNN
jgi:hypothetical protein